MNSRKSTRLSRRHGHGADSVDRISDLPDSILGHILSFLPTKNAVATHILSKRWIFVWTTATNLNFLYPDDHCTEYEYLKSNDFVDFVNYVLLLHGHKAAYLNRFSLTLKTESIPSNVEARINSWICAAVSRNVHELFVSAKDFKLPIQTQRMMFGCEGLKSLELHCNFCISSEIAVSLPRLESLRLSSIYIQNEEAFGKLLGGCPVLIYLFMDFYMDNFSKRLFQFYASSTSLRHLELSVHNKCPKSRRAICLVRLIAPSLEYIKLEDQVSHIVSSKTLNSLVEANIQLASLDILNHMPNCFKIVVIAFQSFNCAKALNVSAQVIRALSCATYKMRTKFKRLMRLEVTIDRTHWSSLQDFIKLSDSLEILTIKKDRHTSENYLNNSNWKQPDLVPRCVSNSLRTASISDYCGHDDELEMVAYILKHGSVLQVMKICFDESISDLETKFEMVKKISKFPRNSPVCEVEFC